MKGDSNDEYIKGIIFVILYFTFLYIFGCSLLKDKYIENAPLRFLVGLYNLCIIVSSRGNTDAIFWCPMEDVCNIFSCCNHSCFFI